MNPNPYSPPSVANAMNVERLSLRVVTMLVLLGIAAVSVWVALLPLIVTIAVVLHFDKLCGNPAGFPYDSCLIVFTFCGVMTLLPWWMMLADSVVFIANIVKAVA